MSDPLCAGGSETEGIAEGWLAQGFESHAAIRKSLWSRSGPSKYGALTIQRWELG